MFRWLLIAGLVGLAAIPALAVRESADASALEAMRTLVRATREEESWSRLPWHSHLWDARREAAAQGKPILLWEMDGHPLGCT